MRTSIYFLFCYLVLLYSCANPKPPSGGPPNRIPPKIIKFYPENRTTGFSENRIYITFSTWVDRSSVLNNIFFNPSIKYEVKWSGKKLTLKFSEELPQGVTISFFVGTDYSDLDGNKPSEPFSLVFSTGDKIDSGIIVGKVVGKDLNKVFIYAVPINFRLDSLIDFKSLFHYKTQPNSQGFFKLDALKYGYYLLFGFYDSNGNKEFDKGIDGFGLYSDSILVTNSIKDTVFIVLSPPKDEYPPQLIDVVSLSKNIIVLKFNEQIHFDTNFIVSDITISDSTRKKEEFPFNVLLNVEEPSSCFVFFREKLPEGIYSFIIKKPEMIYDSSGNKLDFSKSYSFRVPQISQPVKPNLIPKKLILANPTEEVTTSFNIPIDTNQTHLQIAIIDLEKKDTISLNYSWINNFAFKYKIPKIRWRSNFILNVISDSIFDYFGNIFLSQSYAQNISVADEPRVGSIKGRILAPLDTTYGNPVIMALGKDRVFVSIINNNWNFSDLPEGEYTLVAFYDKNNNLKYDFGRVNPVEFSERVLKVLDRVEVKKGWTIEEINF